MMDEAAPEEPFDSVRSHEDSTLSHHDLPPLDLPERLCRLQAFLMAAAELANFGAWEWDIARGTVWWSDSLYQILGVERANFRPSFEAFMDHACAEDRKEVGRHIRAIMQKHQPRTFDYRIGSSSNSVVWLHNYVSVDVDGRNEPARLWGISQVIPNRQP